jgi:hypothetical protein
VLAVSVDALTTYYSAGAEEYGRLWASALETDLNSTSEVEVRFYEETPQRTRVELEHRLERHGPRGTPSHAAWKPTRWSLTWLATQPLSHAPT